MGANSMKMTASLCCVCWQRESKQGAINPYQGYSLESECVVVAGVILLN